MLPADVAVAAAAASAAYTTAACLPACLPADVDAYGGVLSVGLSQYSEACI